MFALVIGLLNSKVLDAAADPLDGNLAVSYCKVIFTPAVIQGTGCRRNVQVQASADPLDGNLAVQCRELEHREVPVQVQHGEEGELREEQPFPGSNQQGVCWARRRCHAGILLRAG
jgi:hypothetical protein